MKLTCQIACLVSMFVLSACGDSEEAGGTVDAGGEKKIDEGSIPCGSKSCSAPADSPTPACCKDQFSGTCGLMMGDQCKQVSRAAFADNCPVPSLDIFTIAPPGSGAGAGVSPCCTPNNECGLDVGIGTGCFSNAFLCTYLPTGLSGGLEVVTCDGKPIEPLSAECLERIQSSE